MITNIITQVAGQQQPSSVTTIIKCDFEGCDKSVQFDESTKQQALADNLWLRTYRTVQSGDGRSFGYCGDVCEVKGVESGVHNIPEPPKIVPGNQAAIAAAAHAAAATRSGDANLRSGAGGKIQVTD
jgi:precorrin-3B methylase